MALSFKQIEKVSKALGDNNRLKILYYLAGKGGCGECSALQGVIDLAQPSISHHVKILVESGLVVGEKEGRNYSYTLNDAALNEYLDALRKLEGTKVLEGVTIPGSNTMPEGNKVPDRMTTPEGKQVPGSNKVITQ